MRKKQTISPLKDWLENGISIMGFELEKAVKESLSSDDEETLNMAVDLNATYFSAQTSIEFKPVKFVYYVIVKRGDTFVLRRNLNLSPRANEYFDKNSIDQMDRLRKYLVTKNSVQGSELKEILTEVINTYEAKFNSTSIPFLSLSKQIAEHITQFFLNCENPLKDDVWYKLSSKEYGTATVYRDLDKSPRFQKSEVE